MKTASPGRSADFQSAVSPTCSRRTVGLAGRAEARPRRRITNPRYGAARRSRNRRSADSLVRESPSGGRNARTRLSALRESSRRATTRRDTDRLQVCATGTASTLNTYLAGGEGDVGSSRRSLNSRTVQPGPLFGERLPRPKPARCATEPSDRAVATWSAPVLWRFQLGPRRQRTSTLEPGSSTPIVKRNS